MDYIVLDCHTNLVENCVTDNKVNLYVLTAQYVEL